MPDLYTIDLAAVEDTTFRPYIESEFILRSASGTWPVTLTEITRYPDPRSPDHPPRRKPFALAFRCEAALLTQGIHTLEHPELPACEIFLSPFEGGDGWCNLEAVFN